MCSVAVSALDTLRTTGNIPTDKAQEDSRGDRSLLNRARAKLVTRSLILRLVDVKGSSLHKAYWRTYHCASEVEQRGKTLKTKYCRARWCMVCNRIRTGMLINGYKPALETLKDPQFMTLTFPNVDGDVLRDEIQGMYAKFKKITRRLARKGEPIRGIRKLECTYNPVTRQFNPHYHLIVEGGDSARALLREWLKEYPKANPKAQQLDPANEGSIMELMKYFTKILPSKSSKVTGKVEIHPRALDTMFQAMKGLRVFQPFGVAKHISEDIEEIENKEYEVAEQEYAVWLWEQDVADWVDIVSYDSLAGYEPESVTMKFIDLIQDRGTKPGVKEEGG